jgi:CheY-like chemotaxis protein
MTTVLVVEDDPLIRELLTRMLRIAKYEVITAENGVQAVQRALDETPDLIVMDMGLPVLNGWQATQRIRSAPSTAHVPIIALTAYAMKEDRLKCLSVGCDDYESKPIDFPRLLPKIAGLLRHSAAPRLSEAV